MRRTLLLPALLFAGCAAPDEPVSVSAALDHNNVPVVAANPFPPGTLKEVLDVAPSGSNPGCPECSLSNGLDFNDVKDWSNGLFNMAAAADSLGFSQNGDLDTALAPLVSKAMLYLGTAGSSDNVNDMLGDIGLAFQFIPGAQVTVTKAKPDIWIKRFKSDGARHLFRVTSARENTTYQTPKLFNEISDRAARTWCSWRQAAKKEGFLPGLNMLDHALTEALFWDIGYTRADVTLTPMGPDTKSTAPNGAQAFMIPFTLGAEVAPLKGPLIPDFGTFSHPIAWLTTDHEVRNAVTDAGKTKTWRNIRHDDLIAGKAYSGGEVKFSGLTLMNLGLFQLYLEGHVGVTMGKVDPTYYGGAQQTSNDAYSDDIYLPGTGRGYWDTELLGVTVPTRTALLDPSLDGPTSILPQGLSTNCATELGWRNFSDWALTSGCDVVGTQGLFPGMPVTSWSSLAKHGTAARWRQDDDRSFAIKDEVEVGVGVAGSGGINLGIVAVEIHAVLSLSVVSGIRTVFREALDAVNPLKATLLPPVMGSQPPRVAQTSATVTPVGYNDVVIEPLKVKLAFSLWTPFGQLHWDPTIFKLPDIAVGFPDVVPPEKDRLRVGAYSELFGLINGAKPLYSHLPALGFGAGSDFAAQPQSVSQCLADPGTYGVEPDPKPVGNPDPDPLPYGLCFYGPDTDSLSDTFANVPNMAFAPLPLDDLPADICQDAQGGHTPAWVTQFADADQQACMQFTVEYLCGHKNHTQNVSKMVMWGGQRFIAHLIQKNVGEEPLAGQMFEDCVDAFSKNNGGSSQMAFFMAQQFFQSFLKVHVCKPDTLEPGGDLTPEPDDDCTPNPFTGQCT